MNRYFILISIFMSYFYASVFAVEQSKKAVGLFSEHSFLDSSAEEAGRMMGFIVTKPVVLPENDAQFYEVVESASSLFLRLNQCSIERILQNSYVKKMSESQKISLQKMHAYSDVLYQTYSSAYSVSRHNKVTRMADLIYISLDIALKNIGEDDVCEKQQLFALRDFIKVHASAASRRYTDAISIRTTNEKYIFYIFITQYPTRIDETLKTLGDYAREQRMQELVLSLYVNLENFERQLQTLNQQYEAKAVSSISVHRKNLSKFLGLYPDVQGLLATLDLQMLQTFSEIDVLRQSLIDDGASDAYSYAMLVQQEKEISALLKQLFS